jgi:hypothetical protein
MEPEGSFYHIHKNPPLVRILSQMNLFNDLQGAESLLKR